MPLPSAFAATAAFFSDTGWPFLYNYFPRLKYLFHWLRYEILWYSYIIL